jgi:hypothetical protein
MRTTLLAAFAMLLLTAAVSARADDACAGFKWDVSKERALFAGSAIVQAAGTDAASAAVITPDRLFELHLAPQAKVAFAAVPGRQTSDPDSYAGLANLKLSAAGTYRIAVDLPLWIDVVVNGKLRSPSDYQGQRGCSAPHKIVQFELTTDQPLTLQVSSAAQASVRVAIIRVP